MTYCYETDVKYSKQTRPSDGGETLIRGGNLVCIHHTVTVDHICQQLHGFHHLPRNVSFVQCSTEIYSQHLPGELSRPLDGHVSKPLSAQFLYHAMQ